jgi:hypothetical protein
VVTSRKAISEDVLAVVQDQQRGHRVELLGDPGANVGLLGRGEGTTPGHRVPHAQRRPDLGHDVVGGGDPDELDEVHLGLARLAGEHVGHPGLAQATGTQDRRQPPGPHQGPQAGQVVGASEQLVGVEAHPASDGLVGGEQLQVHALEHGVRVDAQPVGEAAAVLLVAGQRGGGPGSRGLAAQQGLQHLHVVEVGGMRTDQRGHRLRVEAAAGQREPPGAGQDRTEHQDGAAYLGQRPVALRHGGCAEQVVGRPRVRERHPRVVVQRLARPLDEGLRHPDVDGIVGEPQAIAAGDPVDDLGTALRAHPRDLHRQRLRTRRAVPPDQLQEPVVG